MKQKKIIQNNKSSTNYVFRKKDWFLGLQFLFVAFGATVLMPILAGIDVSVALFTAGIGTLLFQLINRKNTPPIFLSSSFAYIGAFIIGIKNYGLANTLGGVVAAGLIYVIVSLIIRKVGDGWLKKIFPAYVVGPIIMTIGLALAPVGVSMAMGQVNGEQVIPYFSSILVAFITFLAIALTALLGKGLMKVIPILVGIIVGYITSIFFGMVDFSPVVQSSFFSIPSFTFPKFSLAAILFFIPFAIPSLVEHFGDILAISNVTKKDYTKKPGYKNTMLGDGVATIAAGFFGGPPNTTYSEVTGAVSLTKVFNPAVMTWTAIFAIILAFFGKINGFLKTIPMPVMGGVLLLLFGLIAYVGIQTLVKEKNLESSRKMIIISLILVCGIGGMAFNFGKFQFAGIGLGAILGILANLLLPKERKEGLI